MARTTLSASITMTTRTKILLSVAVGFICVGWAGIMGFGAWLVYKDEARARYLEEQREAAAVAAREMPPPPPRKQLRLSYRFSPAVLVSHDFYLQNTSGENLSEVNLRMTFVGEDASPSIERYWANWPLGEHQRLMVSMSTVKNVQRIEVSGRADEGDIEEVLTVTQ